MIGVFLLIAVVAVALAAAYAYNHRGEEPYGLLLRALVVVILGCAVLAIVVFTLNALDLIGV